MQNKDTQVKNMPSKKRKTHFANAINLDASTPIPIQYGSDSFAYKYDGKKYIPFIGNDDDFAGLLLEARLLSPTQDACVKKIAEATVGDGLQINEIENPDKAFIDWMANVNNSNQSINKLFVNAGDGLGGMGNQFIEVVRGKVASTPYIKLHLHNFLYCRLSGMDDAGTPTTVTISKSFAKKGYIPQHKNKIEIPLYRPNSLNKNESWKKMGDGTERTMIHLKNEVSGVDEYGLPAGATSLRWQVLEGQGAQYNLDMFTNNLVMSGALVLKSAMTQEEAQENAEMILNSHTGNGKQGRIAVISSENGIEDFTFVPYDTQKEGSFLELDKLCEKKIVVSNGWASEFISPGQSSLGKGGDYLRALWDGLESTTLKPLRKKIIEDAMNPIAKIYAEWYGVKEIADYKFYFKGNMPFSFMGDIKPEQFMLVNEAREMAGKPSDAKMEGVYISEMLKKQKEENVPA